MRNLERDAQMYEIRRQALMEEGFKLFSAKGIEGVTLQEAATASGYGIATLFRCFSSKAAFAVEIADS